MLVVHGLIKSYAGPRLLSQGYEQQALGFMFQLKAAEFQTLFYQTFEDSAGAEWRRTMTGSIPVCGNGPTAGM